MLVLLACSLVAGACGRGGDEPEIGGLPFWPEAFPDEPWARDMFRDQSVVGQRPDDELLFVAADYETPSTNIDGYERRSLAGEGPVVWFLGGSTTFGLGQRDEHTTPSEVARLAARAGTPIHVRNFGYPAYLAWQEVGLLRRLLASEPKPDLIVIDHGINDYASVCRQLGRGVPVGGRDNFLLDEIPDQPVIDCQADPARTGRLLDASVGSQMAVARKLAGDIPLVEMWQPYSATRPANDTDAAIFGRTDADRAGSDRHTRAYLDALHRAERPVVDLTDAIGPEVKGPIYFDWVHTNERGARLIAEAMWERSLRDEIAALS